MASARFSPYSVLGPSNEAWINIGNRLGAISPQTILTAIEGFLWKKGDHV